MPGNGDNVGHVSQAQECGEQFQLQDDIQYALDGLCASALPSDRACSAARLAEMAASRRGRLALRSADMPHSSCDILTSRNEGNQMSVCRRPSCPTIMPVTADIA